MGDPGICQDCIPSSQVRAGKNHSYTDKDKSYKDENFQARARTIYHHRSRYQTTFNAVLRGDLSL